MAEEKWSDPNKVGGKYMAGVIADFAPALKEIAKLGSMNNKPNGKYERGSWKLVENPEVEYNDAFWRHLLEGPHEIDPDTEMPHDVAIAWNALALVCFRLIQTQPVKDAQEEPVKSAKWAWMMDYCKRWAISPAIAGHWNMAEQAYAAFKETPEEVCPFCKSPMGPDGCINLACEER